MTACFSHSQCPSIRSNDRLAKVLFNKSHQSILGRERFDHLLYVKDFVYISFGTVSLFFSFWANQWHIVPTYAVFMDSL